MVKIINLLRAEFYKLSKSKAFLICLLSAICIVIINVQIIEFTKNTRVSDISNINAVIVGWSSPDDISSLNGLWYISGCLGTGDILPIILAIIISIFITTEFQNGTISNSVSKGFNKTKIYFSKLILASIITSIILIVYIAVSTIFASIIWGFGECNSEVVIKITKMLGLQVLLHLSIASIFTMLAMIIRNTGITIAISIGMILFISTCYQLVMVIFGQNINLGQYWITYNIRVLESLIPRDLDVIRGIFVSIAYFVVSTMIGCITFNKGDIK